MSHEKFECSSALAVFLLLPQMTSTGAPKKSTKRCEGCDKQNRKKKIPHERTQTQTHRIVRPRHFRINLLSGHTMRMKAAHIHH